MKLTANQKRVLCALEFDTRQSVCSLAKITGLRQHAVRRARDWLIDHEIYKPYVCVDITALGITDYGIYVRHGMSATERTKFLNFLKKVSCVPWLAEMEGPFQFCFSCMGRNPLELDRFLVAISEIIGHSMQEHCVATRLRWDLFPHSFISELTRSKNQVISFGDPLTVVKLDNEELAVLREICTLPEAPISSLARSVGIPISTFQYRINNLIEKRVILGFLAYLNFAALGLRKYILIIYERMIEKAFRHKLEEYCRNHPRITTCLRSISEWSFELDVQTYSSSELIDLRQSLLDRFGRNISRIESLEYITTHKMCPYPGMLDELHLQR